MRRDSPAATALPEIEEALSYYFDWWTRDPGVAVQEVFRIERELPGLSARLVEAMGAHYRFCAGITTTGGMRLARPLGRQAAQTHSIQTPAPARKAPPKRR